MLVLDAEGLLFGPMHILAEVQGNDCHTCLSVARKHILLYMHNYQSSLVYDRLFKKAFVKVACHWFLWLGSFYCHVLNIPKE